MSPAFALAAAARRRSAELGLVWGLIASLLCCLAIICADTVPVPPGYALCVTLACTQDVVPVAAAAPAGAGP